jgi:tetratricopeptide (TPR) repeat protein
MKNAKKTLQTTILLISTFMAVVLQGNAQNSEYLKKNSYKAYLTNSIKVWKAVEKKAQQQYRDNEGNFQLLFDLTAIQYGLLNACVANKNEGVFEQYLPKANRNTDTLLEYNPEWSAAHALKAGILSTEMAFNPMKGMSLGPRSSAHIEKSIRYDENEPLGWIQRGGSKLHTPKMFGGNIKEAIESYEQAISLFEQDSGLCKNNWQYLNTKAWLGIAYAEDKQYKKALAAFEDALEYEPGFDWVKYHLLPELKKNLKEE